MKKSLLMSFKAAFKGIAVGFKERNIIIHAISAVLVLTAALIFKLSLIEYAVIILTIITVISAELLNTAIEKLVDMVSPEYSPHAGLIKDISAAAVLVCAAGAVVIGILIFYGHFYPLFHF